MQTTLFADCERKAKRPYRRKPKPPAIAERFERAKQSLIEVGARFLIAGHDEPSVAIELTTGGIAIVDESDAPRVLERKWRQMGKAPFTTTEPAEGLVLAWCVGG